MDNVLELEAKVEDLEKRIEFLYRLLYKQQEVNQKLIEHVGRLQDTLFEYTDATDRNTQVLNTLGNII